MRINSLKILSVRIISVLLQKHLIMATTTKREKTRFDTRLPSEQKRLLERAAYLGGYKNLSHFIIMTAQNKAKEILREREQIIASEEDGKIFFEAITHPNKPNKHLMAAVKAFKSALAK